MNGCIPFAWLEDYVNRHESDPMPHAVIICLRKLKAGKCFSDWSVGELKLCGVTERQIMNIAEYAVKRRNDMWEQAQLVLRYGPVKASVALFITRLAAIEDDIERESAPDGVGIFNAWKSAAGAARDVEIAKQQRAFEASQGRSLILDDAIEAAAAESVGRRARGEAA